MKISANKYTFYFTALLLVILSATIFVVQKQLNEKSSATLLWSFLFFVFLITLLMIFLIVKIRDETNKRIAVESDYKRRQVGLEQEVNKRTEHLLYAKINLSESLERITDAFVSLDNNWCYTYLNKKAGEIFNRDPEKLIGKNIWVEFPEGINQPFYFAYYKAMEEQNYIYLEEYYPPYDAWFENHIYPSPRGLSIYFRNITEKKNAELELKENELRLKESEDRFHSLFEQASDAIVTADEKGNLLDVNSSFCKLLGFAKEELLNQNIRSLMDPQQLLSDPLRFDLLYQNHNIIRERKLVRIDGTIVDVEVNVKMIPDGRILSIFRDIRERKKNEELLRKNEEKFRILFERNLAGIFQSNVNGNIITCNNAFAKILGYNSSLEIINEHASMLYFSEKDRNKFIKLIREKKVVTFFESILKHKNGSPVNVIENSSIITDPATGEELLEGVLVDITQQKKIDFNLAIALKKLTFHLNNSPLGIIEWDKNFLIQSWSKQAEYIFEWKEHEVINKNCNDLNLIFEEDLVTVNKVAVDLMSGNFENNNSINRNNTKSGELIYCQWFNSVLKDENGNIQSILSFILDITENKEAEMALVKSENHLRTILQTEPQCIKLLSKNNELLDMNPAGLAIIEADSLEVIKGKSILSIIDEPYRKAFTKLTQDVFKGNSGGLEFEITGLKGTHHWLETNAVPLKDSNGNIYSLLGVTRDITERKKTEIRIIESEEKFRTLVDLAPIGIFLAKPDGYATYANDADLRMTGLSWEESQGFNWINAIHPDDRSKVLEDWKNSLENGIPFNSTGRYLHKDGKIVHWDVSTAPVIVEGSNIGFIGIVLDITNRIKAEQEIITTSEQLRQLSTHLHKIREEERAHIAREIHDELGQSLTALKIDTSWLKNKLNNNDEHPLLLNKLEGMIKLLNETVQTVRRISSDLRPGIIDDLGLIAALDWHCQEFEKRTSIKCSFNSDFKELEIDKNMAIGIFRIFQEALTNVTRHAQASEVELVIEKKEDYILLKIKDNGIGIQNEHKNNLKTHGLLGMRERAIMLGGKFKIDSGPGKGTSIFLEVPFNYEPELKKY